MSIVPVKMYKQQGEEQNALVVYVQIESFCNTIIEE